MLLDTTLDKSYARKILDRSKRLTTPTPTRKHTHTHLADGYTILSGGRLLILMKENKLGFVLTNTNL